MRTPDSSTDIGRPLLRLLLYAARGVRTIDVMTSATPDAPDLALQQGLAASAAGIAVNVCLALVKVLAGVFGNSYALIADGIESSADVVSSLVVWGGLKVAARPPDENHPYGHGKAESLAALVAAVSLVAAAVVIAVQSVHEIRTPHGSPAWFTLPILLAVVVVKTALSRYVLRTAGEVESTALKGDAWHHRADAFTSASVFVGVTIGVIGGKGYEAADDWAALLACGVIAYSGVKLLWTTVHELMDVTASDETRAAVTALVRGVPGVVGVEKCWARKYGLGYVVDLHVVVDGDIPVRQGHRIAHAAKDALRASDLRVVEALIHVEPDDEEFPAVAPTPAGALESAAGPARLGPA
jgi:cation diffusion facilitator family transporter